MMSGDDSVTPWSGHRHGELSEGSLEEPVSSAVYFYDAGGSTVAEFVGTGQQASHEDFTQTEVQESNPRKGQNQNQDG